MTSSTLGMNTTVSCDLVPHYQEACFAARVLSVRHALHFLLCLMLKDITIFWLIHLLYDIKLVNEDFCYMENGHIRVWVLHYLHLVHKFMWNRLSQYLILRSLMDSRCVKLCTLFCCHICIVWSRWHLSVSFYHQWLEIFNHTEAMEGSHALFPPAATSS